MSINHSTIDSNQGEKGGGEGNGGAGAGIPSLLKASSTSLSAVKDAYRNSGAGAGNPCFVKEARNSAVANMDQRTESELIAKKMSPDS